MSVTRTFAEYIAELQYEDIPLPVRETTKEIILDSVACTVAGRITSHGPKWVGLSEMLGKGSPEATIFGHGTKVSSPAAAFANSSLASALDMFSSLRTKKVLENEEAGIFVVGNEVVPAALAVGELVGASGKDLISAVVVACEVGSRIAHSIHRSAENMQRVWSEPYGTFGSAIAAGKLLRLSKEQLVSAIGMAGAYTPVPSNWKFVGCRPIRDIKQAWGWQCMGGIIAALSAQYGVEMLQSSVEEVEDFEVPHTSADFFEGADGFWAMLGASSFNQDTLTEGLGKDYLILSGYASKVYPGGAFTHGAVQAIRDLMEQHHVEATQIEKITAKGDWVFSKRLGGFLPGFLDAQFSSLYAIAMAVYGGPYYHEWYSPKMLTDTRVQDLMSRVTLVHDDKYDGQSSVGHLTQEVEVLLRDGRILSKESIKPQWSRELANEKFSIILGRALGRDKAAEELRQDIMTLEEVDSISGLMTVLQGPFNSGTAQ